MILMLPPPVFTMPAADADAMRHIFAAVVYDAAADGLIVGFRFAERYYCRRCFRRLFIARPPDYAHGYLITYAIDISPAFAR